MRKDIEIPKTWINKEFNLICNLSEKKFNPKNRLEKRTCIELEHIEKETGRLLGVISSNDQLSTKNVFIKGNILFGKLRPNLRKFIYCTFDGVCSSEIWVLVPEPETESKYVFYLVQQDRFIKAACVTSGSKMPRADWSYVSEVPFLLPPLPEQKAIADLLSTWDEVIEKTERLIQAKEKRLNGYMQKLISQKCNIWAHIKPKKIFDIVSEKNFPDEELLSVTQDRGVIPRSMLDGRVMSPAGTTASYKLIKCGDFAISLRSFQGGIEYSNYRGIISPAYTVLRTKTKINNDFYRLFFKSNIFIKKYLNLAVIGIRDGKQISIPDFMSIKIPVPPLDEQQQIAGALTSVQQEIDLLKQLAEKYKTQKRGLMQKLLAGLWRMKPEVVNKYMEV